MIIRNINGETTIESEGKLLEVIPIITDPNGMPSMLPPVVWHVANENLGFRNYHALNMPMSMMPMERVQIPGSSSYHSHTLSYYTRIMEASPSTGIAVATVDASAVQAIVDAIKEGVNR